MKTKLHLILLSIIISSCNNNKDIKDTLSSKLKGIDNSEIIEILFNEFHMLYNELIYFKDKSDFKTYGFNQSGPYYEWLIKVQSIKDNPEAKLLPKKYVSIGELELLGLAYASSNGKETELTDNFNKIFSKVFSSKLIEKTETSSGNINYDKLKSEYELFGKWIISIKKPQVSYPYEIFVNDNTYVGVVPVDDFRTEILEKSGNKYTIKGNRFGEYYTITTDNEMTLYDNEGELKSNGYIAKKHP